MDMLTEVEFQHLVDARSFFGNPNSRVVEHGGRKTEYRYEGLS